ncbi:BioF -keto--aminopelargonate synthetase [Trichoderma parareesei]|uniref:BioF-keto--aminopelargonate synthetase n=1 Tax=Trichoderma parareesei TaxID=858221 RepID=A0A2H2ZJ26_TRIPA|nr:BioF -keto--aminopelargonate synthetase [Trichoderma parareesei]
MPPTNLDRTLSSILSSRLSQGRLRRLTIPSATSIDFSSNSYLSLSSHPAVKAAYISLLTSHLQSDSSSSSSPQSGHSLGSGGSRLLDGNSAFAEDLERQIADFHGAEAGLLFNSGFEANTGLFACVPQKGDVIVYDELIHASVHDGMRLSRAQRIPFAHNRVYDAASSSSVSEQGESKYPSLDALLQSLTKGPQGEAINSGETNIFIAVEGIYSMDGDAAPLKHIVECVEKRLPKGNGYIIVDEAHSTGILGPQGRGLVCQLGLQDRIWARVHTFGKAMGCSGAIVLCSSTARNYLINYARSFIYTTAMSFPSLASIHTTYNFLASGHADPLIKQLCSLIHHMHSLLADIIKRHAPSPELFRINPEVPQSPILPLFTNKARSLAQYCQERGFTVRPIVAPTVPMGQDRVRRGGGGGIV